MCVITAALLQLFIQSAEFKCRNLEVQKKCAFSQDAFDDVVKYFGENPKTTPPSVFFPVFVRFVKAYKVNGSVASLGACLGAGLQATPSRSWLSLHSSAAAPVCLGSRSGWSA